MSEESREKGKNLKIIALAMGIPGAFLGIGGIIYYLHQKQVLDIKYGSIFLFAYFVAVLYRMLKK